MTRFIFILCLLLGLLLPAFGQESLSLSHNIIKVDAVGFASTSADSIVITCKILISDEEDQAKAERRLTKRVKSFMETLELSSVAPTTSFGIVALKGQSVVFSQSGAATQPLFGWAPPQLTPVASIIFSQDIVIKLCNIKKISANKLSIKIAELLQKLSDATQLTVESDVTSPSIDFICDNPEKLRQIAQKDAMDSAKKQAEALAKVSERKLGKCVSIRCTQDVEDISSKNSKIEISVAFEIEYELID